ncbi:MAG: hypothetical protein H7327_07315, partial [Herminiimonas sp.]|nr:hypothetical protein [Herminiimonas sp.]
MLPLALFLLAALLLLTGWCFAGTPNAVASPSATDRDKPVERDMLLTCLALSLSFLVM